MRESLQEITYSRFLNVPWYKKMEILRVMYGWGMDEASKKCGISYRVYWNWEKGKCKPIRNNRKMISEAFNVSEDDMFGDETWAAPRR